MNNFRARLERVEAALPPPPRRSFSAAEIWAWQEEIRRRAALGDREAQWRLARFLELVQEWRARRAKAEATQETTT